MVLLTPQNPPGMRWTTGTCGCALDSCENFHCGEAIDDPIFGDADTTTDMDVDAAAEHVAPDPVAIAMDTFRTLLTALEQLHARESDNVRVEKMLANIGDIYNQWLRAAGAARDANAQHAAHEVNRKSHYARIKALKEGTRAHPRRPRAHNAAVAAPTACVRAVQVSQRSTR